MVKSNFLIIAIVLVLVFIVWLLAQTLLVQVKNARQISGSDSYSGASENIKTTIEIASSSKGEIPF